MFIHFSSRLGRGAGLVCARGRRAALDFLYPPVCLVCLGGVGEPDGLCSACWSGLSFIDRPYCERLGLPFSQDMGPGALSPEAIARPPSFNRARAAVRYDSEPARKLVQALKYADRTELAGPMGRWMARAGRDLLDGADLLVPVPLHRRRLLRRRYNQAAELAKAVGRITGAPWDPDALRRTKPTPPQVGLSRAQRSLNVQGAFHAPESVHGRRVLLIDDVLTSGATLDAAARALLRAGAASVDALVFARVVNDGAAPI